MRLPPAMAVALPILGLALAPVAPAGWEATRQLLGPVSDRLASVAVVWLGVLGAGRLADDHRWAGAARWLLSSVAIAWALVRGIPLEGERLHVVQYGMVTILLWAAMSSRRVWWTRAFLAAAGSFGFGCLEEAWQAWLPNRAGEWRDVLLNAVGALWGVLVLLPWVGLPARSPQATADGIALRSG